MKDQIKDQIMQLTKEEVIQIKCWRGEAATGYPWHTREIANQTFFYYWPWGEQPDDSVQYTIASKDPAEAAALFLDRYERCDDAPAHSSWKKPVPKVKICVCCGQALPKGQ
jgi:hypothetical protein